MSRRTGAFGVLLLFLGILWIGACSEPEDYTNPYDPENVLTAGSPPDVRGLPGDRVATISWFSFGMKGISAYRIYRLFEGDPFPEWTLIGEVPALNDPKTGREVVGHRYEFIDDGNGAGLLNDQEDFAGRPIPYRYRISVVDANGVETPDPANPPDEEAEPFVLWPSVAVTPSTAPDPPRIEVVVDDLVVQLSWADYEPPGDAVLYRVYGALVGNDPNPKLQLLDEIPIGGTIVSDIGDPAVGAAKKRYVDTDFKRDLMTKEYLVTVVDKFGVESPDTPELRVRATTPNLPPKPVAFQITNVTTLGPGLLQVEISWSRAPEADVRGYTVFASDPAAPHGWIRKKTINSPATTKTLITEESIFLPEYFVSAFDNTAREDGNVDQIYPPGYFEQ